MRTELGTLSHCLIARGAWAWSPCRRIPGWGAAVDQVRQAAARDAPDVAPAAAVGDVAQLLDVHVDQRAGLVVFVAADRFTGAPVEVGQPVQPAADQHGVHRRGRQAQLVTYLDRPEPLPPAQPHDPLHHRPRGPRRAPQRAAGPVLHVTDLRPVTGGAQRGISAGPAPGGLGVDLEPACGSGERPPLLHHQVSEFPAGSGRQRRIRMTSVQHGRPPVRWSGSRQLHSTTGGLPLQDHSGRVVTRPWPTSVDSTP
jgi:hypothetical protein